VGSPLATVSGPDAVDPGSNERAAADLRFQRLERVRAQRRSRQQRRLIFISVLVLAMAGVCALGFAAIRRALPERAGAAPAHVPVGAVTLPAPAPPAPAMQPPTPPAMQPPTPPAMQPPTPPAMQPPPTPPAVQAPTPPAVLAPPITSAPTRASSPTPAEGAKPDAVVPRRTQPEAPPARDVTPPTNRLMGAPALQGDATTGSEPGDGTAAIDWLLNTSRTKDQ
jgi:outer membrane biosynthesis protein TonB